MTRRTQFAGSAAGRRRERRAHLQSEVSSSSEVMHRPTPNRVVLQCKRQASDRVFKAASFQSTKTYDTLDNCCLPQVAIFSVKTKEKESITARA